MNEIVPLQMAPVSVVVPCYRCSTSIRATVASVAAQTRRPKEVILVDDCSGDDTLATLHSLAAEYAGWIRVVALEFNGGPSGARNRGWAAATQDYIAFLDADDSWHPRKIEIQMGILETDLTLVMLGHEMNVQPIDAPTPIVTEPIEVHPVSRRRLILHNPFPTASVILRRDIPFRFDESRRRVEDFLLWAQIVLSGYNSARINQILASWHKPPFGAGGLSGDIDAMYRAGSEVFGELHEKGLLTSAETTAARLSALVRHVRRRVITRIRKGWQRPRFGASS